MMAVDTIYHHEPSDEHRVTVEKVRFDYVRTLTDLYIENMLRPVRSVPARQRDDAPLARSATGCRSS